MNLFSSDLWADMREKRLWPVAVALVLALIAVPLVLAKPAEQPPSSAMPTAAKSELPELGLQVLTPEDTGGEGSALDLFDSRDPFRPPQSVIDASNPKVTPAAAAPTTTGTPVATGPSGATSTAGAAGSSGDSSGSGGSVGGGGETPTRVRPAPKAQAYTYVIDVTLTRGNHTRRIKGMRRLDMLPNSSSPLLVFLGVDSKAANAVFLADSSLELAGEGKCKPSDDDCNFLYLGAGNEHTFSDRSSQNDDGKTYTLRIDAIRRVKVQPASKASRHERKRKSARKADAPHSADAGPSRRFVPPLLADLLVVSSEPDAESKTAAERR